MLNTFVNNIPSCLTISSLDTVREPLYGPDTPLGVLQILNYLTLLATKRRDSYVLPLMAADPKEQHDYVVSSTFNGWKEEPVFQHKAHAKAPCSFKPHAAFFPGDSCLSTNSSPPLPQTAPITPGKPMTLS